MYLLSLLKNVFSQGSNQVNKRSNNDDKSTRANSQITEKSILNENNDQSENNEQNSIYFVKPVIAEKKNKLNDDKKYKKVLDNISNNNNGIPKNVASNQEVEVVVKNQINNSPVKAVVPLKRPKKVISNNPMPSNIINKSKSKIIDNPNQDYNDDYCNGDVDNTNEIRSESARNEEPIRQVVVQSKSNLNRKKFKNKIEKENKKEEEILINQYEKK